VSLVWPNNGELFARSTILSACLLLTVHKRVLYMPDRMCVIRGEEEGEGEGEREIGDFSDLVQSNMLTCSQKGSKHKLIFVKKLACPCSRDSQVPAYNNSFILSHIRYIYNIFITYADMHRVDHQALTLLMDGIVLVFRPRSSSYVYMNYSPVWQKQNRCPFRVWI
jgi:hypothetical protein